jgi:chorismate mutase
MRFLPHRTGATTLATLAAFAGAILLVHFLAPHWVHAAGLDVWEMDETVDAFRREDQRKRDLDDVLDLLNRQIGASDAVALALIEDRISFAAAVAEMDEINRDRPSFEEVLVYIHPEGRTHRERIARYTIARVRSQIVNDPTRQAEVTARLEAAYRSSIANH